MSKTDGNSHADKAAKYNESYNCAQSVLAAYADDYGLDLERALQIAVGFGAGMGRKQDVCGAISGAVIVFGLASKFKVEDSRPKINEVYPKVHKYIDDFKAHYGTVDCLDLLDGCDLSTDEGRKRFMEDNRREKCREYIRFCCDLLDKHLGET